MFSIYWKSKQTRLDNFCKTIRSLSTFAAQLEWGMTSVRCWQNIQEDIKILKFCSKMEKLSNNYGDNLLISKQKNIYNQK